MCEGNGGYRTRYICTVDAVPIPKCQPFPRNYHGITGIEHRAKSRLRTDSSRFPPNPFWLLPPVIQPVVPHGCTEYLYTSFVDSRLRYDVVETRSGKIRFCLVASTNKTYQAEVRCRTFQAESRKRMQSTDYYYYQILSTSAGLMRKRVSNCVS